MTTTIKSLYTWEQITSSRVVTETRPASIKPQTRRETLSQVSTGLWRGLQGMRDIALRTSASAIQRSLSSVRSECLKRNIGLRECNSPGEGDLPIQIKTRYDVPGRKQSGGLCGQLLPRPSMASSPELRRKAGRCICFPSVGLSQAVRQSDTVVGESILKGKEIYPAFSNQVHGWKGRSEMTSLFFWNLFEFCLHISK